MAIKEQNRQCLEIIARILEKIYSAVETIEGRTSNTQKEDNNARK